jgi:MOSC domain-containing protein YiiM
VWRAVAFDEASDAPVSPVVTSVSRSGLHTFSKPAVLAIRLVAGLGVDGDAHLGEKVKHRSRVRRNPHDPNLRQVHLIHEELFAELGRDGFDIVPGAIGENVTTRGIDLLGLPTGARLRLGPEAVVEITGLRHPCRQLDAFQPGLMAAVLGRDAEGGLVRKSGVMGIVITGGDVTAGDAITVELPAGEQRPLVPV